MSADIDEIKNRLAIEDIISEYIKLKKAGSGYRALCPFHSEKTPSFHVSPDRGIYKCFGCGESGDIFSFVQKFEGLDFPEVKKKLAERAGVVLTNYGGENKEEVNQRKREKERLLVLLNEATKFFQKNLLKDKEAKKYLKKRGVDGELAKKFRLGLALDQWNSLEKYLMELGFNQEEILRVGLIKKNDSGKIYDRFRNRIIFPIFDQKDNPVAFSGRDLSGADNVAKYLNSPETEFFDKSDILYGFNFARVEARKRGYFIVVEGQMDLVMSHRAGFQNTVATSGTSLTEKHLENLSGFSKNLIFAFDSDRAGIEAAFRGIKKALALDFDVKILDIPSGLDPADIILENPKKWVEIVKNSKNIIEFYISKISLSDKDLKQKNKEMEEKIYPFVVSISSPIERGVYVSKIASAFGVTKDDVEEELELAEKKIILENKKEKERIRVRAVSVDIFQKDTIIEKIKKKILKELTAIYYWQKKLTKSEPWVEPEKILEIIKKYSNEDIFQHILALEERQKEYIDTLIFQIEEVYNDKEKHALEYDLGEMERRLKIEDLNEKISILHKKLDLASDKERIKILQRIQELTKEKNGY